MSKGYTKELQESAEKGDAEAQYELGLAYGSGTGIVTDMKEAVILNETPGPQLQEFADSLADEFIEKHPELEQRLLDIDSVLIGKEWNSRSAPDIDTIKRSFGYSAERLLIVNHKYLEKTIKNLEKAVLKDIKKKKVYGKVIKKDDNFEITNLD